MIPAILIDGTWSYTGARVDAERWSWPGSPFWRAAEAHGVVLLGRQDPFVWSSDVGGFGGRRFTDWKSAGEALRWYAALKVIQRALSRQEPVPFPQRVKVVGYSYGGNVACYAAARAVRTFEIDTLVLLGTPLRGDMRPIYVQAVQRAQRVIQVSGGTHLRYERLGGLFDGLLGITRDVRELLPTELHSKVEVVTVPRVVELIDPVEWTDRGWWGWLLA